MEIMTKFDGILRVHAQSGFHNIAYKAADFSLRIEMTGWREMTGWHKMTALLNSHKKKSESLVFT